MPEHSVPWCPHPCTPLHNTAPEYLTSQYPSQPAHRTAPRYLAAPYRAPRPSAAPNIVRLTATALFVLLAAVLVRPLRKLVARRLMPRR